MSAPIGFPTAFDDGSYWGVAQTLANHEIFAGKGLQARGYEIFQLRCRQRIKNHSRIVALWPGYLLVKIVDHFWTARRSVGVIDLLMKGDRPISIPQAELDKLAAAYDPKTELIKLPKAPKQRASDPQLQAGDHVRILTGQFRGLEALYEGMSAHDRVLVLLAMLGRQSRVELGEDDKIAAIAAG
jgi:transcription antitermination factor NusG